jgi:hypothetical protein
LTIGLTAGALTAKRAPNYGRVALIQSAALGGAIFGAAAQLAFKWKPYGTSWEYTVHEYGPISDSTGKPILDLMGNKQPPLGHCTPNPDGNFNCAVPDNSIFDLAPGALIGLNVGLAAGLLGAYLPDQSRYGPSWKRILLIDLGAGAGALAGGVGSCVALVDDCLKAPTPQTDARAISAWVALAGGGLGALAGILLTRDMDEDTGPPPSTPMPIVTYAPMRGTAGGTSPGIAAMGFF